MDSDKNLKPYIPDANEICRNIRTFWKTLNKKNAFFLVKKQCSLKYINVEDSIFPKMY